MKNLVLVKLGGSLITNKSKPKTFLPKRTSRLVKEIKTWTEQNPQTSLVLAHGSGSFGHVSAKKYQTHLGFLNKNSKYGFCVVRHDAWEINFLLMEKLLNCGLNAVSLPPSMLGVLSNRKIRKFDLNLIYSFLQNNFIPVVFGDQFLDTRQGCSIASGETTLNYLAKKLTRGSGSSRLLKTRLIQATIVNGVLNKNNKVVARITPKNYSQIKKDIFESKDADVTGGMLHKVEAALQLTKVGISTQIISGKKPGNLLKALRGERVLGTLITAK